MVSISTLTELRAKGGTLTLDESLPLVGRLDENARLGSRAISMGAFVVELPPQMIEVVSRAYTAAASFFSLEDRKKRSFDARANGTVRGWTKTSSTAADIEVDHLRDYEAFDVALPRAEDPSHPVADKLFDQANAWPSDEFRIASEELIRDVCEPLERSMWPLLERSAGLPANFFAESSADSGLRYLRHLTYPSVPTSSTTAGFYPHKDFEAFTIHLEDSPGIEVHDPETGSWISVRHGKQRCLVLIGHLGELLSSGKLKAALHRVRVQPSKNRRHAVAYFSAPSFDTPITGGDDVSQDSVATVGDYLTQHFMKSYGLTR